jgi:hypothetical protein
MRDRQRHHSRQYKHAKQGKKQAFYGHSPSLMDYSLVNLTGYLQVKKSKRSEKVNVSREARRQHLIFSLFYTTTPSACGVHPFPGPREKRSFSWVGPSEGELSELRFNVQANEFPFAGEGVDAAGGRGSGIKEHNAIGDAGRGRVR